VNPTLPLVLLLASTGPEDSRLLPEDRRGLARFSARWSVRLEPVSFAGAGATARSPGAHYAPLEPIVARIEALLDTARLSLARLDEADGSEALASAERLLLDHPELPQAAWLRAEQLTIAAELAEPRNQTEAAHLRRRAAALEGSRATPFRETDVTVPNTPSAEPVVSIPITGVDGRDGVEWNGAPVRGHVTTHSGEHAVRVLRGGRVIWSSWVSVDDGMTAVNLGVPPLKPCSAEDLASTRLGESGPLVDPGVLCARWAVARRSRGELELARCEGSQCGTWERLIPEPATARAAPEKLEARPGFPAWATITLASVGAVLATSVVLWQTGAFDADTPPRERWVYRGNPP